MNPVQVLLPLTVTEAVERRRFLVEIPDRLTAEDELAKLKREHGPALADATIRKARPGPRGTYTLRYTLRTVETRPLIV